jgi:hypothetical protein
MAPIVINADTSVSTWQVYLLRGSVKLTRDE